MRSRASAFSFAYRLTSGPSGPAVTIALPVPSASAESRARSAPSRENTRRQAVLEDAGVEAGVLPLVAELEVGLAVLEGPQHGADFAVGA